MSIYSKDCFITSGPCFIFYTRILTERSDWEQFLIVVFKVVITEHSIVTGNTFILNSTLLYSFRRSTIILAYF